MLLSYTVASCSSECDNHPVRELQTFHAQSRGWQSSRWCDYPQELVLQFPGKVTLQQVQVLSHQFKITSRVELFMGTLPLGMSAPLGGPQDVKFTRLGHFSLDSNERSGYQARELKTVYVPRATEGAYLKLVLHKCHINEHNLYNQLGLLAVRAIGSGPGAAGASPPGDPLTMQGSVPPLEEPPVHQPRGSSMDSAVVAMVRELEQQKKGAVTAEDYDEAKRLKARIDELKAIGVQLAELERKKTQAVADEDYDAAKDIKKQLNELRHTNGVPLPPAPPVLLGRGGAGAGSYGGRGCSGLGGPSEELRDQMSLEKVTAQARIDEMAKRAGVAPPALSTAPPVYCYKDSIAPPQPSGIPEPSGDDGPYEGGDGGGELKCSIGGGMGGDFSAGTGGATGGATGGGSGGGSGGDLSGGFGDVLVGGSDGGPGDGPGGGPGGGENAAVGLCGGALGCGSFRRSSCTSSVMDADCGANVGAVGGMDAVADALAVGSGIDGGRALDRDLAMPPPAASQHSSLGGFSAIGAAAERRLHSNDTPLAAVGADVAMASCDLEASIDTVGTKAAPGILHGSGGEAARRVGTLSSKVIAGGPSGASGGRAPRATSQREHEERPVGQAMDAGPEQPATLSEDLPPPEPLSAADEKDAGVLLELFGEHLVRCLYSKVWNLRQHAVQGITALVLQPGAVPGDARSLVQGCAKVVSKCTSDKMVQVYVAGMALFQATLGLPGMPALQQLLSPLTPLFLAKLGDGNVRVREASEAALLATCRLPEPGLGPQPVLMTLVAPLDPKRHSDFRLQLGRLALLSALLAEFGPQLAVHAGEIMRMLKTLLESSRDTVRTKAVEVAQQLHGIVGNLTQLTPFPSDLDQQTLDQLLATLEQHSSPVRKATQPLRAGAASRPPTIPPSPPALSNAGASAGVARGGSGGGGRRGGGGGSSSRRAGEIDAEPTAEQEPLDEHTCQFCGLYNADFTEEKLDLHFWKECPMLMPCEQCGQIVEVVGLNEHILTECDQSQPFRYQPPLAIEGYRGCPLCAMELPDNIEAAKTHLSHDCQGNARRNGGS